MRHHHCRLVKPNMELQPKLPTSTRYGAHMDIGQYGDLNTLQWVENEFDPEPNMVHCEVIYGESAHHRMLSFLLQADAEVKLPAQACHPQDNEGLGFNPALNWIRV